MQKYNLYNDYNLDYAFVFLFDQRTLVNYNLATLQH